MAYKLIYNQEESNIVVIGEFEDSKQIAELTMLLDMTAGKVISITFIGTNVIPKNIIEKLYFLQEEGKCTVFVTKRYLYSYLQTIGIRCKYIQKSYSLEKSNQHLTDKREILNKEEVCSFLRELNSVYGYDYTEYQIDSIMRRINIAMIREDIKNFYVFREQVLTNEKVFHDLFLDFSINTTEFFRDSEVFTLIKNKILPYLNSYNHIKIWCAGCSNGKEVYSLAIMLKEAGMLGKTQIYATDINPYVVEEAKNGIYSIETLNQDICNYRNAQGEKSFIEYFQINKSYIKVKEELQKNILFFQHSLLSNGTLNEFNLILCRNVFIYFKDSLQERVLKSFYNSLENNGFLVLGKSEGIQKNNGHKYFLKYDEKLKIYKKIKLSSGTQIKGHVVI